MNVFQMLDDEKSNAEDPKDESKVAELSLQSTLSQSTDSAASDDVNWTVQSSTRTRRLVPGWKLPKQEGDSPRNKPLEVAKKKGKCNLSCLRSLHKWNRFIQLFVTQFIIYMICLWDMKQLKFHHDCFYIQL